MLPSASMRSLMRSLITSSGSGVSVMMLSPSPLPLEPFFC
jgi:hypothetical protein